MCFECLHYLQVLLLCSSLLIFWPGVSEVFQLNQCIFLASLLQLKVYNIASGMLVIRMLFVTSAGMSRGRTSSGMTLLTASFSLFLGLFFSCSLLCPPSPADCPWLLLVWLLQWLFPPHCCFAQLSASTFSMVAPIWLSGTWGSSP